MTLIDCCYTIEIIGETFYYLLNAQGDVLELVDETGISYVYDAWGRWGCYRRNGAWRNILLALNPFLYRSYVYDHETSLYYLQSRYYDLNTHRFLNAECGLFLIIKTFLWGDGMAVSLEYLHAKEDIPEFIVFLYSIGSYIRHRENPYICQDILSQDRAVNALIDDLSASFGTYYIGKGNNAELLSLDSCGRQGHPRNLGRRGRFAGRIICDNKDDSEAMELFRQIRNYFRRTYNYQRYNGNARMSCYFGPHYQRLDNKYAIHPDAEGVCPGYLRIICREMHKESVSNLVAGVFSEYKAAIPYVSSEWCNYWQDTNLLELRVELLYHSSMIDYDKFLKIACVLHESSYIVNAKNCKLYMSAPAYYPLDMVKNDGRKRIFFIMEHPR